MNLLCSNMRLSLKSTVANHSLIFEFAFNFAALEIAVHRMYALYYVIFPLKLFLNN